MPPVAYTLTRRRMKNVRMTVVPGGEVRVSAPLRMPLRDIDAWVAAHESWLTTRRASALTVAPPLRPGPVADALRPGLHAHLGELIELWAPRLGVGAPLYKVRIMRTRWGTCNTATHTLTFALELARREPALVEYVVVHELAHLREPNHGSGFQSVMNEHLPDWKSRRSALR